MHEKTAFAVIFDMDGVIFDSEKIYIETYKNLIEADGRTFIEAACIDSIGANWEKTCEIFRHYYGDDFDFAGYRGKVKEIINTTPHELKPGVFEIFDFLRDRRVPVALASSTKSGLVMKMLGDAGLSSYFDAIICGDMVSHSKPHPEIFLKAADALGTAPADCYVIEDSFNGVRAAHAAGMMPVMVPDIVGPDDEMREIADFIFPSLLEVKEFFSERIIA